MTKTTVTNYAKGKKFASKAEYLENLHERNAQKRLGLTISTVEYVKKEFGSPEDLVGEFLISVDGDEVDDYVKEVKELDDGSWEITLLDLYAEDVVIAFDYSNLTISI